MATRGRFRGHRSWLQFRDESVVSLASICFQIATIFATIGPRSHHDQAAIGPRSGHDRGPGHSSITFRSTGDDSTTIPLRNLLDHGSIAPRSWFYRSAIVEFFYDLSPPLD